MKAATVCRTRWKAQHNGLFCPPLHNILVLHPLVYGNGEFRLDSGDTAVVAPVGVWKRAEPFSGHIAGCRCTRGCMETGHPATTRHELNKLHPWVYGNGEPTSRRVGALAVAPVGVWKRGDAYLDHLR